MHIKLKSFLSLSGIIAGVVLVAAAHFWLEDLQYSAKSYFETEVDESTTASQFADRVINGIKWLAYLLLGGSLILFFLRKKFNNRLFAGIFAAVVIVSLLISAFVASTNS